MGDGGLDLVQFAQNYYKSLFGKNLSKEDEQKLFDLQFKPFDEAISKGFNKGFKPLVIDKAETNFINSLRFNAATFATFKNHSFSNELVKALVNENGEVRNWNEFKIEAEKLNQAYNKIWLKTEYDTAVGSSVMAGKWQDFEKNKDLYPNLKYRAINDARTRVSHKNWNGIILPMNHPFWDTHYPPNDWGCRCDVTQTDQPPTPKGSVKTEDGDLIDFEDMPKLKGIFNNNVGKTTQIFDKSHPYFDTKEYKEVLSNARNNFEYWKLKNPNYKKVGNIEISDFADLKDLKHNITIAEFIYSKLKYDIKIRPHVYDIKTGLGKSGYANPEFLINGLIGDVKTFSGKEIKALFSNAKNQGNEIVIFENKSEFGLNRLIEMINGQIKLRGENPFKEVIIIIGNDVHVLK